jgi:hypothetical protein
MFGFNMIVHGIHGGQLPTPASEPMSEEELEVLGLTGRVSRMIVSFSPGNLLILGIRWMKIPAHGLAMLALLTISVKWQ